MYINLFPNLTHSQVYECYLDVKLDIIIIIIIYDTLDEQTSFIKQNKLTEKSQNEKKREKDLANEEQLNLEK